MNCKEFLQRLDAWIDGELAASEKDGFLRHARDCSACGEELRRAEAIREALSHMNDDLCVPVAAQAAWRRAVKKESGRRKGRALYRALSAVAAALVLLAGTTAVFRSTGVLDFENETAPVVHIAASGPRVEYYDAQPETTGEPQTLYYAAVETDGAAEDALDAPDAKSDARPAGAVEAALGDALSESGDAQERLFVRSAVRELYTETFDATRQAIGDLVEEYNGNMISDTVTGEEGSRSATLAVDVPAEEMDAFLDALDFVAKVTCQSVSNEDISTNYYDAQGRLETLRLERDRLNSLISEAANAEELAALDARLSDVYEQIEALEGKLRGFENQLDYARVDIALQEGAQLAATAITGGTRGGSAERGFARSLESLGSFFRDMGVSLAVIAPYAGIAVLLIAVVWIAVVIVARRRRRD